MNKTLERPALSTLNIVLIRHRNSFGSQTSVNDCKQFTTTHPVKRSLTRACIFRVERALSRTELAGGAYVERELLLRVCYSR